MSLGQTQQESSPFFRLLPSKEPQPQASYFNN